MKTFIITPLCLPILFFSQSFDKPQTGFSIRASINILPVNKNWKKIKSDNEPQFFNFRISANAGIASYWISNALYPSLNLELQLYNGGFGAGRRFGENDVKFPIQLDTILAFTITTGFNNNDPSKQSMLRYFSDFATPSLKNPFISSFSLGTNFIITTDSKKDLLQRVGFLNFNFRRFQLSYYNDGGFPLRTLQLGDKEDRYYTGGGNISYDILDKNGLIILEVGAHKFTGYTKSAFEFSNETESKTVRYSDLDQYVYNKSLWRINFFNLNNNNPGYGASLSWYNLKNCDVQYLIHKVLSDSFHPILYDDYLYFEPFIIFNNKK